MLLALAALFALNACATREPKPPGPAFSEAVPEVRQISFRDTGWFESRALRKVMATKGRPFLQPWKHGEPYDPRTLEADLLRLRKYWFDRGYLDASASIAGVTPVPDAPAVDIEIAIDKGPETRVDSLHLEGVPPPELPPEKKLLQDLPLQPGDRLTKEGFDKSRERLLQVMQNAGYARAAAIPHTAVDGETHMANVRFKLEPGERTTFGRITVKGNSLVPDEVILREIRAREGDTYSLTALQDSQQQIFDLGMFRAVTPRALNIREEHAPVDVEFDIRERKPRTIKFGIGASSVESMRYEIQWINRNLFAEAQRLSVLGRVTGISQSLEVDLRDPYLFNRDTSMRYKLFALNYKRIQSDPLGILSSIFNIVDPFPAYDLLTAGAEWRVEHDFSKRLGGTVGLEFTSNTFYNVDLTADKELLEGAEDNRLFIQFAEAQWDMRDNKLVSTRGYFLRAKLDHSNTALLSDVNFGKINVDGRYYVPLPHKLVLAMRLKLGGIQPYGDSTNVPSNVRFFAGGPGSVRGYEINRLGPLDSSGNPIGGNSLMEGSVELRFPIAGPLQGTAFVDFGNVFESALDFPLDRLKYSVGAGIAYATPVGPLRLELAYAIDPDSDGITSPFLFSIGQSF